MFTAMSTLLVLFVAIAYGFLFTVVHAASGNLGGQGISNEQKFFLTPSASNSRDQGAISVTATTTKVYLNTTDTASSTITGNFDKGNQLDLFVVAVGSSSAATLRFVQEYSSNAIDWYPTSQATGVEISPLSTTVTESPYTFSLSTTTNPVPGNSVLEHFVLRGSSGKYFRIRFGVTGANASVFGYASVQEATPN